MSRFVVIVGALLAGVVSHVQGAFEAGSGAIGLHGLQAHEPQNLAIVLDCSARAGQRFAFLRRAAVECIRGLALDDIVSVVAYGDYASVLVPAQPVGSREAVIARIESLRPKGEAALFAGMSAAAEELRKNGSGRFKNRMFVLNASSGNVGPHSEGDLRRFVDALAKEGVRVFFAGAARRGEAAGEGRPCGFRGRFSGVRPGGFGSRGFGLRRMRFPCAHAGGTGLDKFSQPQKKERQ